MRERVNANGWCQSINEEMGYGDGHRDGEETKYIESGLWSDSFYEDFEDV